jgi:hypothetical protein
VRWGRVAFLVGLVVLGGLLVQAFSQSQNGCPSGTSYTVTTFTEECDYPNGVTACIQSFLVVGTYGDAQDHGGFPKCPTEGPRSGTPPIGAPVSSAQHARDEAAFLQACAAYLASVFPGPGFPVDTWCRCFLRYAESTPGSAANESSDDLDQIVSRVPDSDGIRGVGKWIGYYGTYSCYS